MTTTHTKPGTGKNSGYTVPLEQIGLIKEAQSAHNIWRAILTDRIALATSDTAHKSRVHYDQVDAGLAKLAGTPQGALLQLAVDDAKTRSVEGLTTSDIGSAGMPAYDMAVTLEAQTQQLYPPVKLTCDESTHCSHGVSYADPCDACGP